VGNTKIEWAAKTWNPITGCSLVSEGCENCYAKRMASRLKGRFGYPDYNPFRVTFHPDRLGQPLKWKKSQRIFVCSMGDIFHEDVKIEWIDEIYEVTQQTPHQYLFLTKRPENIRCHSVQENVWMGVSVENQEQAMLRIPELLKFPGKKFVSCEPLLDEVDLSWWINDLDWVIVGGETGHGARSNEYLWFSKMANLCRRAEVPFFFKHWGSHYTGDPCDDFSNSTRREIPEELEL